MSIDVSFFQGYIILLLFSMKEMKRKKKRKEKKKKKKKRKLIRMTTFLEQVLSAVRTLMCPELKSLIKYMKGKINHIPCRAAIRKGFRIMVSFSKIFLN